MADVAAVGIRLAYKHGRSDEIKRMIPGLGPDGVFAGLRHVAVDALAAGAGGGMVSVFRNRRVCRPDTLPGPVAGWTWGVGGSLFDCHRQLPRAVRIVTVGTLYSAHMHNALRESVALHAILRRGSVAPKLRNLLSRLRLEKLPVIREVLARIVHQIGEIVWRCA